MYKLNVQKQWEESQLGRLLLIEEALAEVDEEVAKRYKMLVNQAISNVSGTRLTPAHYLHKPKLGDRANWER